MKKLLQINPVIRQSTSTGRIMEEIGKIAMASGWESYVAYSGGRDRNISSSSHQIPIGTRCSVIWHALMTRLFDRHGLSSNRATRKFIQTIKTIQPDIIHIHNLHGYFINYQLLFQYLSTTDIPVIWTIHDCWLYTGHCYHYASAGCDKWKTGCHDCMLKKSFPASWFADRSAKNYLQKKASFTSVPRDRFLIVTVSEWMKKEMQESFLKDCRFKVIHNGIDLDTFHIASMEEEKQIRKKYGLEGKKVILGVASIWSREKGLDDLIQLSSQLEEDERLVLVGVDDSQKARLTPSMAGISRTSDAKELSILYSLAEVFVNPTWQDNYPTVNMEAIACGTPVITYNTGGSIESITDGTGLVVAQGDLKAMLDGIRAIGSDGKTIYQEHCRNYAEKHFNRNDRFQDYIRLYEKMTGY